MGRIKKVAGPKHEATVPPVLRGFVSKIPTLPLAQLPQFILSFPTDWPFPRGDLYHWIPALDHFDTILQAFVQEYGLDKGPQTKPLGANLLSQGLPEKSKNGHHYESNQADIERAGLAVEGDQLLVEVILNFSRMLMENCGNRSLYSSSERLGDLLNTTSLSLLLGTLRLASRLASRYFATVARRGNPPQSLHTSLLATHYNINYHHVQKIFDTTVKVTSSGVTGSEGTSAQESGSRVSEQIIHGTDLFGLAVSPQSGKRKDTQNWDQVVYDFYDTGLGSDEASEDTQMAVQNSASGLPGSSRRSSGQAPRARPSSSGGEMAPLGSPNGAKKEEQIVQNARRTITVPCSQIETKPLEELLGEFLPQVPKANHFDLLSRLRMAKGLCGPAAARQELLAIRIVSVNNLAYIYPEKMFESAVIQPDSDQPRHLQLAEQLRKLVHDAENSQRGVPLELKTIALGGLEGLLKHGGRQGDVVSALGINVSHGSLLQILRQAVADLSKEDAEEDRARADGWREALFSLLENLPQPNTRTAETLVTAGLFEILVDALKLRTERAERVLHKILVFLNSVTHNVRDAYQTFANNGGLAAIADLVLWEVTTALEQVKAGKGIEAGFRSQVMDYQMPFFKQQTLRGLLKYVNSMMHFNSANVDRLLRNLIDSPPLLTGLREIIANSKIFGSSVWSSAITIMTNFIHNEPTSYAVVAEAGLTKALLSSVIGKPLDVSQPAEASTNVPPVYVIARTENADEVEIETRPDIKKPAEKTETVPLGRTAPEEDIAKSILPGGDAIINIPAAFGAICLNASGLELFLQSGALDTFFEVFESPAHIQALANSPDFPRHLGTSFEELIRHHPRLKPFIMRAVVLMLARVAHLCAQQTGGPKLSISTALAIGVSPASRGSLGHETSQNGQTPDVVMTETEDPQYPETPSSAKPPAVSVAEYIAVAGGFLIGFCESQSLCLSLIQGGGLGFILDMATVPNVPYDFHNSEGSQNLCKILHMLAEYKPHLVVPSLLTRAIQTLGELEPLIAHQESTPFFADYLEAQSAKGKDIQRGSAVDGTEIITAMVKIETLTSILAEMFSNPMYSSRSSHGIFNQVNLMDLYQKLIEGLGRLHRACVWEEIMLQNAIPDDLKELTKASGVDEGSVAANAALGTNPPGAPRTPPEQQNGTVIAPRSAGASAESSPHESTSNGVTSEPKTEKSTLYQDVKLLRFLLSLIPQEITSFLSSLGRTLFLKRRLDGYLRQNNFIAADTIARALIDLLQYPPARDCSEAKDHFAYYLVILSNVSHIIVYGSFERSHAVCCTILLNAFKNQAGLELLTGLLQGFFEVVKDKSDQELGLYTCAIGGMKILLTTFREIVQAKTVIESASAQQMTQERDERSPNHFRPAQFLVEVRTAVLAAVKPMWGARLAEKSSSSIVKGLLDILRTILEADSESTAFSRGDLVPTKHENSFTKLSIEYNRLDGVVANGHSRELAHEALFRCLKNREMVDEYCDTRLLRVGLPAIPIPEHEKDEKSTRQESTAPPSTPEPGHDEIEAVLAQIERRSVSDDDVTGSHAAVDYSDQQSEASDEEQPPLVEPPAEQNNAATEGNNDVEVEEPQDSPTEPNSVASAPDTDGEGMAMSIDNLLNITEQAALETPHASETTTPPPVTQPAPEATTQQVPDAATPRAATSSPGLEGSQTPPAADPPGMTRPNVTVDDLKEARDELRKSLIDHVLDILSVHEDITFDLADLISTATSKAADSPTMCKEVGETLVQSLISFQMEDDFRPMGKKVASYANLLAILIQEDSFYEATRSELKDNFAPLLAFVKVFPDQPAEERSPWVGQILLVLEKLLAEDCQPRQIRWLPPDDADMEEPNEDPLAVHEPLVPVDEKLDLFNAITSILPRIGKDQSLALSVLRILVILTRDRAIASALGEKRSLQRLFVMVKQVAGQTDERFQKAFMLVLRHIAEDEATVRAIVRKELVAFFLAAGGRAQESTAMVRQLVHLVLRSPVVFLEVVNDTLKLQRFEPNSRNQHLVLKDYDGEVAKAEASNKPADKASPRADDAGEGASASAPAPPSADGSANAENGDDKTKTADVKTTVLENPDGVVHFLLSELLSYGSVEDKDPEPPKEAPATPSGAANGTSSSSTPTQEQSPPPGPSEHKKSGKAEYLPEQHPIYNYRCFLLQCLTELLMSYQRAKIEFISFSRKADPKATTPSKPRSGVLNYLLSNLVPLSVLEKQESIAFKKKWAVHQWTMCVIVSLCVRPSTSSTLGKESDYDGDDADLLFVRKFVLENLLKAFKDAQVSNEPLEPKYARLMSLGDLFYRLLLGRVYPQVSTYFAEQTNNTFRAIARLMFEKSFIAAFTTAIADIDLNFPHAHRVVKYILRPLKILTDTGVYLSQHAELPAAAPGQTEDDEISTASSVSDVHDGREETPDLFRNSALGVLEPSREEDLSDEDEDEDEDEDMLDEEYDVGEYDDGIDQDDDEVVSEEEMGDAGAVEGLPGDVPMDVEVVINDEDDDGDDGELDSDDDMNDDDEDMDDMEEITEDDENDSLSGGEVGEWQDEEDDEGGEEGEEEDYDEGDDDDEDLIEEHGHPPPDGGAVQELVRDLERDVFAPPLPGLADLGADVENGRYMPGDMAFIPEGEDAERDEDDEDEGEDEADMADEIAAYEPDYEDEDNELPDAPGWGMEPAAETSLHRHIHQSHARRLPIDPFDILPTRAGAGPFGEPDIDERDLFESEVLTADPVSGGNRDRYRSRTTGGPRGTDDSVNPLLQRPVVSGPTHRSLPPHLLGGFSDWVHMLHHTHRSGSDPSAVSFINSLMSAITRGVVDRNGTLRVQMDRPQNLLQALPPFPGALPLGMPGMSRVPPHHHHDPTRPVRDETSLVPLFYPTQTSKRWQEEANLLFGSATMDKTQRVLNSIMALLVPLALEEEKARKEQEKVAREEREKRLAEEAVKEQERLAKEKEEKESRAKKEQEEREAAEREAAAQAANQEAGAAAAPIGEPMEGVEASAEDESNTEAVAAAPENAEADPSNAEAGPSTEEPQERVRATIRGREVDITGMGIDLEYLNALPEEFREEVLMQQVAEQRTQAANAGAPPTEITQEFLDALPDEIRREIVQQEAHDRRRREREEARRQAAGNNEADAAARAEDMDPASFFASLDPMLRQAVLMDQDEDMLAQLPAALRAEAQALGIERPRWYQNAGLHRSNAQHAQRASQSQQNKKKPRRQVVQMVDKTGVATLLRLLFVPQNTVKDIFLKILENITQNRQNRAEIMTLLLSILQEGSADATAVERSFIQLTSRAKQSSSKTPTTPKRGMSGSMSSPLSSEMTPLMVMQQCLTVLVHLTNNNIHVPSYFLTEHEISTTLRGKSTKKGKAKENRSAKFPLNSLLGLLDRKMIMESAACMEQLCILLRSITYPLTILRKKDKPKEESKETTAGQSDATQAATEAAAQTANSGEAAPVADAADAAPNASAAPQEDAQASAEDAQAAETGDADKKEEKKEEEPQFKKQRTLVPPVIPEQNLRLVVGILAARDCSSKTFRETISTIDNLSSIASTRPIFGLELIKQAQKLGDEISTTLDELIPQLQKAEPSSGAQSAALAKFQPSSSDQAKLLRVLTALDYLFDSVRNATKSSEEEGGPEEISKDYLTTLYENATFGPLWSKLSECLRTVRQRDHAASLNVATILLPLVEALMVVCKNTTLKDQMPLKETKEFAVQSPQPESGMESLFFRFTEDHRKILNDLVRQSPRLMSGTFALLVKNPKVLDFDNKRNYFSRRLHERTNHKPPQPPLQISVRRDQAFMDSYSKMSYRSADEIKFGKLSVRFQGEEGVDAGGVTREWFQVMSRQMFNPDYALFKPVASDRTTFHPNKLSEVNPEHLAFFKFIGRIIGKALYEGRALDCHFSRAVYKRILGKTVSIKDMETLDLDYYKSLLWMLENDISDIITETFSIEVERFGTTEIIDLMENGRNVPVTEENKQEYVQLMVEYRLTGSVKAQLEEFLRGFHDIIPAGLVSIFNEQELELLISGLPEIDVDDWKNHTDYHNYSAASPQIQWFWRAVRSFDKEERAKLLQFVTGTSKVPLNGFKELEGMNGFSRFNIHRDYGNKDRLPSSHTCFNQLDLPEYDEYESLRKQLHTAMTAGSEYFGFA